MKDVKIIGSGGLDEYDLADFSDAGAPYDSYGVGTKMGVSGDAPWLDIAYKLVEYGGHPVLKLSPGKISWPGKKQIFRQRNSQGQSQGDIIGLRDENLLGMEPLLHKVMDRGKVVPPQPTLDDSRTTLRQEFASLPESVKAIRDPSSYPVKFTPKLSALLEQIGQEITHSNND